MNNHLIERNAKIILELIRNSSFSKNPIYSKVRIYFDGDRFILTVFVNRIMMDKELSNFLDELYDFVSKFSIKDIYIRWESEK